MEWREILFMVLAAIVFLGGSPIIQLIKNLLSKLLKVTIEDRWAVAVSLVVSFGLAVLEMFLTGQFSGIEFSLQNLPDFFASVYAIAQIYFSFFKNSDSALGKEGLLSTPEE